MYTALSSAVAPSDGLGGRGSVVDLIVVSAPPGRIVEIFEPIFSPTLVPKVKGILPATLKPGIAAPATVAAPAFQGVIVPSVAYSVPA